MPDLPSMDGQRNSGSKKHSDRKPEQPGNRPRAGEGYIPRNVDLRMNLEQARIVKEKLRALQDVGAKTRDGRYVDCRAQVLRWVIENEIVR